MAVSGLLAGAMVAGSPAGASASSCRSWGVLPPNNGPDANYLYDVAVLSACNAWAVGDYYDASDSIYQSLIEHWNGREWKVQPNPNPGSEQNELFDVAAVSARNVWAVGSFEDAIGFHPLIEHWNGKTWKVQPSPNPGPGNDDLNGIDASSSTNAWAVGTLADTNTHALAFHCC